ncbi:MAG: BMC domain-containing protein [Myxococcales bacterium]|nr:BMC domain-containing protein [Myxococcales bacterium]
MSRGGEEARGGPAIAILEMSSVARGMVVADAMVKRAVVRLLRSEHYTPGKYVVLVSGGEEEVGEARARGIEVASATLIDELYLPKADEQLFGALDGLTRAPPPDAALAIVESYSVTAAVLAADTAVKAAEATLVKMRLARSLGGKAFFVLAGELDQIEAAVDAATRIISDGMLWGAEIIARPHPDFLATL